MTPNELANICCNKWLSSDYMNLFIDRLNATQRNVHCILLNFLGQPGQHARLMNNAKPRKIAFIINCLIKRNAAYLTECDEAGKHWSLAVYTREDRTLEYCDSLAYPFPEGVSDRVAGIIETVYGTPCKMKVVLSHKQEMVGAHHCTNMCTNYPLQNDNSSCGIIAIISMAMVCVAERAFNTLTNKKDKTLNWFFVRKPSDFKKHLRLVCIDY